MIQVLQSGFSEYDENVDTSNTSSNSDASETCSSIRLSPPVTYRRPVIIEDSPSLVHKAIISDNECDSQKKKGRISYSLVQVRRLESVLTKTPYPDIETLEALSQEFGIPQQRIKVWFQNKRARRKRLLPSIHRAYPFVPFHPATSIGPSASPYSFMSPASVIPHPPFYHGLSGSGSTSMMPSGYLFPVFPQLYQ
ncbi:homeobox protein prophet of Pit-1-like [Gigantopelta aegis]|uniref:homeobox protein prophet of Pit-1-like n=1 Tax=Gigantopelta aegis TaxID=1735272 RepID=UPI001B88D3D9|nr:homeobox protein prophet of Pit-1-like [Gigantopelta aegis]